MKILQLLKKVFTVIDKFFLSVVVPAVFFLFASLAVYKYTNNLENFWLAAVSSNIVTSGSWIVDVLVVISLSIITLALVLLPFSKSISHWLYGSSKRVTRLAGTKIMLVSVAALGVGLVDVWYTHFQNASFLVIGALGMFLGVVCRYFFPEIYTRAYSFFTGASKKI